MSLYELAILGHASSGEREILTESLRAMVEDFGLVIGVDVIVHDGMTAASRDKHAAFAAVYFGGTYEVDAKAAQELVRASAPVIPTVAADGNFELQIRPSFSSRTA